MVKLNWKWFQMMEVMSKESINLNQSCHIHSSCAKGFQSIIRLILQPGNGISGKYRSIYIYNVQRSVATIG